MIAGYERAVLLPKGGACAARDAVLLPETAGAAPTPPAPPAAADAEAELKRVCAALGHVTWCAVAPTSSRTAASC